MNRSGFGIAASNARTSGGEGAVCEVVEMLLKAQGHWDELLRRYKVVKP